MLFAVFSYVPFVNLMCLSVSTLLSFSLFLLRQNSYDIKLSVLKCTIQGQLVHSQCCTRITSVQFQHIVSPQRKLCHLSGHSLFPPFPGLAITSLLSVGMDLPILDILYKWNQTLMMQMVDVLVPQVPEHLLVFMYFLSVLLWSHFCWYIFQFIHSFLFPLYFCC